METREPSAAPSRPRPIRPGDRLPALSLASAPDGRTIAWRETGRDALLAVLLRSMDSDAAREYLRRLTEADSMFRKWGGRPTVIVPGSLGDAARLTRELGLTATVLADPGSEARRRCGIAEDAAALILADRWAVVYHVATARSELELPSEGIIMQWLRYIATQCPECGVPDEPGYGEWAR